MAITAVLTCFFRYMRLLILPAHVLDCDGIVLMKKAAQLEADRLRAHLLLHEREFYEPLPGSTAAHKAAGVAQPGCALHIV
jgi:hypothetical protein